MLSEQNLKGIYVPVVTPFQTNHTLDLASFESYLKHLLVHDINGLVINGTTGECPTTSWEEVTSQVEIAKIVMKQLNKTVPIVIGTGTNDTLSSLKRTERAGELGADAVLVVTPYYNKPTGKGVVAHFSKIAEAGVPVIAYEIPGRTGIRLSVDTIREILDIPQVIGLKDSSGGVELVSELSRYGSKPVLCGEDLLFHASLSQGASGGMLASANLNTAKFIDVYNRYISGEVSESKKQFDELVPLIRLLFQEEPNPAPLKWILTELGWIESDSVRLPLLPISDPLKEKIKKHI
ncbi:4-hydroxy-tetrahydrodipicolinate synthase [Paenibacillus urinalis]|uniref:4-hydroxy-tetrahydrodipicolinate synthase n=1 Tax=Paenibacillus urinalis TaxID=521520 RepID=A0AAX3MX95_9BACL|nr:MULTISPECIES: 4-hydroxy-tetrahydrodipicolinate synthase [Paenibacillus]WDH81683.1 4-hydroxy-tetrahydrodipicolinate synthase [Paenibacillus urinalis]WDH97728.1 4-hydroxy-tetrahydrodipicolinate synthase [Paenibacillus urinalis]WDI01403.1 4-hydroxy-tetrahydrodipicolinate synthase [Paenibacillus urinalis]GAK42186.1 dihydrodipicolinate synthase [Paenibacillus sp. TCA20]